MVARVNKQGYDGRRRDQLVQQLQSLRRDFDAQLGHARDVAARPVKAGDEPDLDGVGAPFEDDWNGRGRRLCRKCGHSGGRGNYGNFAMNQIGRHRR